MSIRRFPETPPLVTSLPAAPRDGQRITFIWPTATTGANDVAKAVLQYAASDASWYPESPVILALLAAGGLASSATSSWQDSGVRINPILPGDYDVSVEALIGQSTNGGFSPALGPTDFTVSQVPPHGYGQQAFIANETASLTWRAEFYNQAANHVLSMSQFTNDSTPSNSSFANKWLFVQLLRAHS